MHAEHYISTTKITVCTLWGLVAGLMAATWVLAFAGEQYHTLAVLFAFTAGALAPAAAVAHFKMYAMKMTHLIRVAHGLPVINERPSEVSSLHSVP